MTAAETQAVYFLAGFLVFLIALWFLGRRFR